MVVVVVVVVRSGRGGKVLDKSVREGVGTVWSWCLPLGYIKVRYFE